MKYCICLRGAHYNYNNIIIDYKKSFENYTKILFPPILEQGHEIYIFFLTYHSNVLDQLIQDYAPKAKHILPESEINANIPFNYRQKEWHAKSVDMIHQYESEHSITFDYIINTRFDLEFKPLILSNIDYEKVNILYKHVQGNCDDNFFLFPRNHLPTFANAIQELFINNKITHEISHYIGNDNISYICPMPDNNWINQEFLKYMNFFRIRTNE